MSEPTMMTVRMTVRVPVDSDNNDAACLRHAFAWLEELEDKAREQGEVVGLEVDDLPPRIVLVARDSELEAMRAMVARTVVEEGT